ncbi:MAG: S41 family peptidase [Devosia sp.]
MTSPIEFGLPSIVDRARAAAMLRAGIEGSFAHWEAIPDIEFEVEMSVCIEYMMEARDRLQFGRAIQQMLSTLRNGHTNYYDQWLNEGPNRTFGCVIRPLGERWTVIRSRRPGLPAGTVVTEVDGVPIPEVLRQNRRYISASSERQAAMALFANRHLFPDTITLTTEAGAAVTIDKQDEWYGLNATPLIQPSRDRIGRMRIVSFDGSHWEDGALEALEEHDRDAPLVLDLRGNTGGSTPTKLVHRLMERPYRYWRSTVLQTNSLARAREDGPQLLTTMPAMNIDYSAVTAHRGPIAIVVDASTGSAAEDFVAPFKDNKRAIIVGETTGGSSGQPHYLYLGLGFGANIGAKRESFPDGRQFEGVGIEPDIVVETTPEHIAAGADYVMKAALDALS